MRHKGKKVLAIFLALALSFTNLFVSGSDTKEVYATGATEEFTIEDGVLVKYNGAGGDVVIPEGVTSIGANAFEHCESLTGVTFSKNLESIGWSAFYWCESLESIEIPESVTSIAAYAFASCDALKSIIVDKKNTTYDSRKNCNAIIDTATNTLIVGCKTTTIPDTVTSIGSDAFFGNGEIGSIEIPENVTELQPRAFYDATGLTSIKIPKSVTSIGEDALAIYTSDDKLRLIVEEGSYAEDYAAMNGNYYMTYSEFDAEENPVLTKETMNTLIEKNGFNDLTICADKGVKYLFEKGSMTAADGMESYDFGTTITTNYGTAALPASVAEGDFVAKISYNYAGQLSDKSLVKIPVGKEYTGQGMKYSLLKADNTLGESCYVTADTDGYITIEESSCGDAILTLTSVVAGDTNQDNAITAEDALGILKHVVGLAELTGDTLLGADVNGESQVTAEDALEVLKKVVGLVENFRISCTHDRWECASCTKGRTCTLCGKTEGSACGHNHKWMVTKDPLVAAVGICENMCTICGDVIETKEITATEKGFETPWVYSENGTHREKTLYDGTVLKEDLFTYGEVSQWGYFDDKASTNMNIAVNAMLSQVDGMQPFNANTDLYDDAKMAAFAYAHTMGSSQGYHSNHGGLPNVKTQRQKITLVDGKGEDNYIACFVRDVYQESEDFTYGRFWSSYFGTYYASSN